MQTSIKCESLYKIYHQNDFAVGAYFKIAELNFTLESGDLRKHQGVYSLYVFQEPSKVCTLNVSDGHNQRRRKANQIIE